MELLKIYLKVDSELDESWMGEKFSLAGEGMFGDWRPVTLLRVWKRTAENPFMGAGIPEVSSGSNWDLKRQSFNAQNEHYDEIPLTCAGRIGKEAVDLLDLPDEEAIIMVDAYNKKIQDAALRNEREVRAESDLQYFLRDVALQSVRQHCQDTTRYPTQEIID